MARLLDLFAIDRLPILWKARSYMASSYDREGGNFDWNNYARVEAGEAVVLDVEGPGVITRIWSADPKNSIRVYVDGSRGPSVDMPFVEYFRQAHLSWGRGTARSPEEEKRLHGYTSYDPIPFVRGCRLVITPPAEMYYQVNYTLFDAPVADASALRDDPAETYGRIRSELSWGEGSGSCELRQGSVRLGAGERATILDEAGGYVIRSMAFVVPHPEAREAAGHLREKLLLRCYWDADLDVPQKAGPRCSVRAPLAYFFMDFGESQRIESSLIRSHGQQYQCRFPMPFRNRGRIDLVNNSCVELREVRYCVRLESRSTWDEDCAHFRALYHHEDAAFGHDLADYRNRVMFLRNVDGADNYRILDTRGSGHFVGCCFYVDRTETPYARALGESDEAVFVDDDPRRTMWGTGNEDYVNDAWGFHPNSTELHGSAVSGSSIFGYRFHISDRIPYEKKLRFTLEHGSSNNCTAVYRSVAYYYEKQKPFAQPVDGVPPRVLDGYFSI